MSFARQSKLEILNEKIEDTNSAFAFLSGLFHGCGQLTKNSNGVRVDLVTDIKEMFEYVNEIVRRLYGENLDLEISDDYIINKTTYYRIKFPIDISQRVMQDCGLLESNDGSYTIEYGIDYNVVCDDDSKRAFVKGAFLSCSTSSIKLSELGTRTSTSGYHLEFASHRQEFLQGLQDILGEFTIPSKLGQRKNLFILYLKDSESIKDLLAFVGCNESVLALSNEMATRGLRNTVNRQVNCINANINKTVEASLKQIEAINYINQTIGLENLPDDLQEVAVLRLANQQESMEELLKLSTIQLTKSGLNHRFKRLLRIAEELKNNKN